jgi:hypothetical protein
VLFLGPGFASPARCLAALLPALLAGVPHVAVARVAEDASPWPAPVLAGLELAGQELAFALSPGQAQELAAELEGCCAPGALLGLGWGAGQGADGPELLRWSAPEWRVGAWAPAGDWDWPGLAMAQAGCACEVWLPPKADAAPAEAAGLPVRRGGWDDFLAAGHAARLVPPELARDALDAGARLVLTPGLEGCWAWPGLTPHRFTHTGLAWAAALPAPPGPAQE